ncbi:MAG TPA: nitroreductase family deazaflavin-dependent oxidoreductase [Acidimicrobiales bacterium]
MPDVNDFNTAIIEEFRANRGMVGGPLAGTPILLLTTTGARSGLERVNPMVYRVEGDEVYVFASKAGAPTNPDWFHNLVANPEITVELGGDTFRATAELLEGEERNRVFAAHAGANPTFADYQAGTDRIFPVVHLVHLVRS